MKLVQTQAWGKTIIQVKATRIDAAVSIEFKDLMRNAIADGSGPIFVDLREVSFVDSSGLGAIVAVRKMLGDSRAMELCCLTPDVEKVFRLTRMDSVFTIHKDVPTPITSERL